MKFNFHIFAVLTDLLQNFLDLASDINRHSACFFSFLISLFICLYIFSNLNMLFSFPILSGAWACRNSRRMWFDMFIFSSRCHVLHRNRHSDFRRCCFELWLQKCTQQPVLAQIVFPVDLNKGNYMNATFFQLILLELPKAPLYMHVYIWLQNVHPNANSPKKYIHTS